VVFSRIGPPVAGLGLRYRQGVPRPALWSATYQGGVSAPYGDRRGVTSTGLPVTWAVTVSGSVPGHSVFSVADYRRPDAPAPRPRKGRPSLLRNFKTSSTASGVTLSSRQVYLVRCGQGCNRACPVEGATQTLSRGGSMSRLELCPQGQSLLNVRSAPRWVLPTPETGVLSIGEPIAAFGRSQLDGRCGSRLDGRSHLNGRPHTKGLAVTRTSFCLRDASGSRQVVLDGTRFGPQLDQGWFSGSRARRVIASRARRSGR
jgi:hypothetical protein